MALYLGMSDSGQTISDDAQIAASLHVLLTTPVGSRVMRRDYGSRVPDLIDAPLSGATLMRLASASYIAIRKWEPRLSISGIAFKPSAECPGRLVLQLSARRTDLPTDAAQTLEIPL